MRDSSLQKICAELNTNGIQMTVNEVKNKIKNFRATCQMLSKIENQPGPEQVLMRGISLN